MPLYAFHIPPLVLAVSSNSNGVLKPGPLVFPGMSSNVSLTASDKIPVLFDLRSNP